MGQMEDDLRAMLQALGTAAQLDGAPVFGIFHRPYAEPFGGVASSDPSFEMASADCPAVAQGSVLVVGGSTWEVSNFEPDGTGVTLLRLTAP